MDNPLQTSLIPEDKKPAVKRDMNREEALFCVKAINEHADRSIALINELRQRNGWKALGYSSWLECAVEEFGRSRGRVYQLLKAAQIQLEIDEKYTAVDTPPAPLPERVLRPLAALPSPQLRQEAFEKAKETAPDGKLTGPHVAKTVTQLLQKIPEAIRPKKPEPKAPPDLTPHYSKHSNYGEPPLIDTAPDDNEVYELAVQEDFARQKKEHKHEYPLHCPGCGGTFWFEGKPPASRFTAKEPR